jgi:hypothetical protein
MTQISITISGEFEEHELAAMVMLLRSIDVKHPERHYDITITDPRNGKSLEEAEAMIRRLVPNLPDRRTKISVVRRQ